MIVAPAGADDAIVIAVLPGARIVSVTVHTDDAIVTGKADFRHAIGLATDLLIISRRADRAVHRKSLWRSLKIPKRRRLDSGTVGGVAWGAYLAVALPQVSFEIMGRSYDGAGPGPGSDQ